MKDLEAANLLLGIPTDYIDLKIFGFKVKLGIRPLSGEDMIRIGREAARMSKIDSAQQMFAAQLEHAGNLKYAALAIAIATGTFFVKIVARAILKLPQSKISEYWMLLIKNSDPDSFFFIMVSAKGLNNLTPLKEPLKEETPSSDVSP